MVDAEEDFLRQRACRELADNTSLYHSLTLPVLPFPTAPPDSVSTSGLRQQDKAFACSTVLMAPVAFTGPRYLRTGTRRLP